MATHLPFVDRGLFFAKAHPHLSYAVARADRPVGRTRWHVHQLGHADPLRCARLSDGERLSSRSAARGTRRAEDDTPSKYEELEEFSASTGRAPARSSTAGRRRTTCPSTRCRTSVGSPHDAPCLHGDGLQQVGNDERDRWPAMMIADSILGRENPWPELVRLQAAPSAVGALEVRQRRTQPLASTSSPTGFEPATHRPRTTFAPGEGAIVGRVRKTAVYRDDDGTVHVLSPVCRHLRCLVDWNPAERSWDCPCHGSRYCG